MDEGPTDPGDKYSVLRGNRLRLRGGCWCREREVLQELYGARNAAAEREVGEPGCITFGQSCAPLRCTGLDVERGGFPGGKPPRAHSATAAGQGRTSSVCSRRMSADE